MMTPRVEAVTEVYTDELRQALFHLRLLLAQRGKKNNNNNNMKDNNKENQNEEKNKIFHEVSMVELTQSLVKLPHDSLSSCSHSLLSVELNEEENVEIQNNNVMNSDLLNSSHHHHHQEEEEEEHEEEKYKFHSYKINNNNNNNKEEEKEEEFHININSLQLPQLRWPLPTRQQRLEAMAHYQHHRQERKIKGKKNININQNEGKKSWLCGINGKTKNEDVYYYDYPNNNNINSNSSNTSSLTNTGDRSEGSSSQDTYAASHVSEEDVYIHELARELGSYHTPTNSVHFRQFSASLSIGGGNVFGTKELFSPSPVRNKDLDISSSSVINNNNNNNNNNRNAAMSESTGITTQMEFDKIGAGEAAPYTSYLFSPVVRIVDLNALSSASYSSSSISSPSSTINNNNNNNDNNNTSEGCTRVCFSPDGSCYLIGTQKGHLWFVSIDTNKTNNSLPVSNNSKMKSKTILSDNNTNPLLLQGHSGEVKDIAFDDVGTFFASAGADACVILWNQRTRSKVRRINTDGGIPTNVRFMPKNNNYILVSIPQHHILRLYNSSTGLPVTRKGPIMRIDATSVAIESCTDPFIFLGDINGMITMWKYHASNNDCNISLPFISMEKKEIIQGKRSTKESQKGILQKNMISGNINVMQGFGNPRFQKKQRRRQDFYQKQRKPNTLTESYPQFEKVAGLIVVKGIPVGNLVVSSMNLQQFNSLSRVQRVTYKIPETNTIKKWAVSALAGARQREDYHAISNNNKNSIIPSLTCSVMLLASFPCDRLVIICIQPNESSINEYKLIPMLIIDGACRIRQLSSGIAFCVDNTRYPTISCTCEEGFVQIIACAAGRSIDSSSGGISLKNESIKKVTNSNISKTNSTYWSLMATLPVPCGGIPFSLTWSPDMRILVAVTEEGLLYQWQRVHLLNHSENIRHDDNNREDEDSIGGGGGGGAYRIQDEVDEWRIYFEREKERQMRKYRTEKQNSNGDSLSGSEDWWMSDGDSLNKNLDLSV